MVFLKNLQQENYFLLFKKTNRYIIEFIIDKYIYSRFYINLKRKHNKEYCFFNLLYKERMIKYIIVVVCLLFSLGFAAKLRQNRGF